MTATININVADLPENDVWFANAAAWNTYWSNMTAEVELDAIATALYVPYTYLSGLQPFANAIQNDDGTESVQVIPSNAMFQSLLTKLTTLDTAFQTMRTELRNAGLITNAQ